MQMDDLFMKACKNNQKGVIQTFLKKGGINVDKRDENGCTPLHYACQKGSRDIVRLLLENGADVTMETNLMLAQTLPYGEAVDVTMELLDKGVDVNNTDNAGNTLLHIHLDRVCNKDAVKEIIKAGADVNVKNNAGNTPLHIAVKNGNDMVARLLIKNGADYKTPNGNGETAIDIAVAKGMETVLELMEF